MLEKISVSNILLYNYCNENSVTIYYFANPLYLNIILNSLYSQTPKKRDKTHYAIWRKKHTPKRDSKQSETSE